MLRVEPKGVRCPRCRSACVTVSDFVGWLVCDSCGFSWEKDGAPPRVLRYEELGTGWIGIGPKVATALLVAFTIFVAMANWMGCMILGIVCIIGTFLLFSVVRYEKGARQTLSTERVSNVWYLVPFFFGIIGGVVAWLDTKEHDSRKAGYFLVFGLVWTVVAVILIVGISLLLFPSPPPTF
jgi:hypothetical protein